MTDALPPPRIDLLVHSPSPGPYIPVLKLLLEPSPPLEHLLAPQLHSRISSLPASARPKSYAQLIDLAAEVVAAWDVEDQAAFLAAHPRIGETKNLSQASQGEQAPKQGQQGTPGEVLKRLQVRSSACPESRGRQGRSCSSTAPRCSTRSTRTPSPACASSRLSTAARAPRLSPRSRCAASLSPFLRPPGPPARPPAPLPPPHMHTPTN